MRPRVRTSVLVRFLAGGTGIRQFLDVGTGLPTADNTHPIELRYRCTLRDGLIGALDIRP